MTPNQLLDKGHPIDGLVGVWLRGEVWAAQDKYGRWIAYTAEYNPKGTIKNVRVLRISKGKQKGKEVCTQFFWQGIGDLIDRIEYLAKRKMLVGQWRSFEKFERR